MVFGSICLLYLSYCQDTPKRSYPIDTSTLKKCEINETRRPVNIVIVSTAGVFAENVVRKLIAAHPETIPTESEIFLNVSELGLPINPLPCSKPGSFTVDISANYFTNSILPDLLYDYNLNMKVMFFLKNPLDRLISQYSMLIRNTKIDQTFEELVCTNDSNSPINTDLSIVKESMYDVHMERWLKYFSLKDTIVISEHNVGLLPYKTLHFIEESFHINYFVRRSMMELNKAKTSFRIRLTKDTYRIEGNVLYRKISKDCQNKLNNFMKERNKLFFEIIKQTPYPYWSV